MPVPVSAPEYWDHCCHHAPSRLPPHCVHTYQCDDHVTLLSLAQVYFKTNKKFIRDYPALAAYVRRIYAYPGMAESINMSHIKVLNIDRRN